jgi:erythrin-vacuolar iron transport family protein
MNMASREIALKRAIEMEEEGRAFYLESAKKVKSSLAKAIFEELAVEENHHIVMIKKIYAEMSRDESLKNWITAAHEPAKLEKIFKESLVDKSKASKDDLAALRFGLEREEMSITYYETLAGDAGSYFEKRFFLALSYEERGHYLRILDAVEYLTDPAGWLYVSERDMVDGG